MVGKRGRGGSTAQGLRAEFIPLDKVAPHPPPPGHVGLIPWDKLAEPACLRITSPRYTLAYGRYSHTNLTVRGALFATCLGLAEIGNEPFCRRLFFRQLLFFFLSAYILCEACAINRPNEAIYDTWKTEEREADKKHEKLERRLFFRETCGLRLA